MGPAVCLPRKLSVPTYPSIGCINREVRYILHTPTGLSSSRVGVRSKRREGRNAVWGKEPRANGHCCLLGVHDFGISGSRTYLGRWVFYSFPNRLPVVTADDEPLADAGAGDAEDEMDDLSDGRCFEDGHCCCER